VSSRRKNLDAFKMVLTDLNGGFIIQGIPPGDYGLLAWEDVSDGAYSHPEFLLPFESRLVSIKVVQNSAQSVELRVIQGK
jgi:hypothetical protein